MKPQPVLIYGTPCVLKDDGGGSLNLYAVVRRDTGAVLAQQQPARFQALAKAAEVLRNSQPHRSQP